MWFIVLSRYAIAEPCLAGLEFTNQHLFRIDLRIFLKKYKITATGPYFRLPCHEVGIYSVMYMTYHYKHTTNNTRDRLISAELLHYTYHLAVRFIGRPSTFARKQYHNNIYKYIIDAILRNTKTSLENTCQEVGFFKKTPWRHHDLYRRNN